MGDWRIRVVPLLIWPLLLPGAEPQPPAEPKISSLFPFGGQQGSTFPAVVRGSSLQGATHVWFDCAHVRAAIAKVEKEPPTELPDSEKKPADSGKKPADREFQLVHLELRIDSGAAPGMHQMRLVTPRGVSNALQIRVTEEPASAEIEPQRLNRFPVVVNGKIARKGETDHYSLEVHKDQELLFEVVAGNPALDPALSLFVPAGSWFDPNRLMRLAYQDEPVSFPGLTQDAQLAYRFPAAGRYLLRVEAFVGGGNPDAAYQLRVLPGNSSSHTVSRKGIALPAHAEDPWEERDFTRKLGSDWIEALWTRSARDPKAKTEAALTVVGVEQAHDEAQDASGTSIPIAIPALIEGKIERPGDIDRFAFSAQAGEQVALEVETVEVAQPAFNPYLRVLDEAGLDVVTNVHSTLNNNGGFIMKKLQPKTIYTFARDGKFTLEIRDITDENGGPSFLYRALVRRQVPHMGRVQVEGDQLNLSPGEVKKLTIVTDQEEGFEGYIALSVEGLPAGVQAAPATEVDPEKPPPLNAGKKERYYPKNQKATYVFSADPQAQATRMPAEVRIVARPVLHGKFGPPVTAKKLLVMVTR